MPKPSSLFFFVFRFTHYDYFLSFLHDNSFLLPASSEDMICKAFSACSLAVCPRSIRTSLRSILPLKLALTFVKNISTNISKKWLIPTDINSLLWPGEGGGGVHTLCLRWLEYRPSACTSTCSSPVGPYRMCRALPAQRTHLPLVRH